MRLPIFARFMRVLFAGVAQLAERHLPKVNVVSSTLITRFFILVNLSFGFFNLSFYSKCQKNLYSGYAVYCAGVAQW